MGTTERAREPVWDAHFDDRGCIVAADWSTGFCVLKLGATRTDAQE